jgi:hypothetical protein
MESAGERLREDSMDIPELFPAEAAGAGGNAGGARTAGRECRDAG